MPRIRDIYLTYTQLLGRGLAHLKNEDTEKGESQLPEDNLLPRRKKLGRAMKAHAHPIAKFTSQITPSTHPSPTLALGWSE